MSAETVGVARDTRRPHFAGEIVGCYDPGNSLIVIFEADGRFRPALKDVIHEVDCIFNIDSSITIGVPGSHIRLRRRSAFEYIVHNVNRVAIVNITAVICVAPGDGQHGTETIRPAITVFIVVWYYRITPLKLSNRRISKYVVYLFGRQIRSPRY